MLRDEKVYQALSELYPYEPVEYITRGFLRGRYKFYPNMTLEQLSEKWSGKGYYTYYTYEQVLNNLLELGYEETSTGVILMLESAW